MALIRDGKLIEDPFIDVTDGRELPADGAVLVTLDQWQDQWERLVRRPAPVGVRLTSDQHPEVIADDLEQLALVALEFPQFRDGRPYSHARLLRDRYGFAQELRAVGDVLLEQIHYMQRVGFDAFEISSDTPLQDYTTAIEEFSAWYQPASDGRATAIRLRHGG